jgi:hypothetical protein
VKPGAGAHPGHDIFNALTFRDHPWKITSIHLERHLLSITRLRGLAP